MRNRVSGRRWLWPLALGALLLPFLLNGCTNTSNEATGPLSGGFIIPLNAANALLLTDKTLDFSGGLALFNLTNGSSFSLRFNSIGPNSGTFTLVNNNRVAEGSVTFVASCAFTIGTSRFDPGTGPQIGETIKFSNCNGVIQSNVNIGGAGTGTLALDLTRQQGGQQARSTPIEATVEVTTARAILINGVDTGQTVSISN